MDKKFYGHFSALEIIAGTDVKLFQDHSGQLILSVFLKLMRSVAFSFRAEVKTEKLLDIWSNYFMSSSNLLVLREMLCFSLLSSV